MSLALSLCFTLALSACNNIFKSRSSTKSNGLDSASPSSAGEGFQLALAKVVKNASNPTTQFDLLGDGSGAMGGFCFSTDTAALSSGSTKGASTCNCAYSYIKADGSAESFEVPTLLHESDLIRCDRSGLPSGISFVKVRVHMTNSDAFSNEVTFSFSGSNSGNLDLSLSSSFSLVQRYQCRDNVFVPYAFGGSLYDPIQSESTKISYPLNFFSVNMGGALSFLSGKNDPTWYCPPVPNDPAAGLDLTVYSVAPDQNGSKQIFPTNGSFFNRHDFYAAKKPSGVFTIPIHAMAVPDTVTQNLDDNGRAVAGTIPPLGFGASPIPLGAGQETCPDTSVTIPAGFHWAKLWLFRADLDPRRFRVSNAIQALGSVSCNPGTWDLDGNPATAEVDVFTDCGANSISNVTPTTLADRILGTSMCVNLNDPATCTGLSATQRGPGCTTSATTLTQFAAFSTLASGTDIWQDINDAATGAAGLNCAGLGQGRDPMGVCANAAGSAPVDSSPGVGDIDTSGGRFDFLFVVTPPTVMTSTMQNSFDSAGDPYRPFRFLSPGDCNSADPDSPSTPGDCPANRIVRYGIKLHGVGSNGDPPADDPNRPGVFPMCVLQPN